tara:strand:+ start:78 stop:284 length:207 start_codon:yes stop_codon:yes gene_type:complete
MAKLRTPLNFEHSEKVDLELTYSERMLFADRTPSESLTPEDLVSLAESNDLEINEIINLKHKESYDYD